MWLTLEYDVRENRCILAKIVWHFDLELACPEMDLYESSPVHMVWAMPNNRIRFIPRKTTEEGWNVRDDVLLAPALD